MKHFKIFLGINLILLLNGISNQAYSCNCGFLVDEVVPCSSLCSSDGSITILTNEQFCFSNFRWGIILDGDTLEDHFSGASGCSACEYTFSNLSPGSYTIYRIKFGSPSCLAEETVNVGGLFVPCQSPFSISTHPSSVDLCADGNIILTNNSNCIWQSYLYDSDSVAFLGPISNTYTGGVISIQNLLGNGLTAGTYYLQSISNLPEINGTTQQCIMWDTIVITSSCFINASVSTAICSNSHCGCSIKVSAITNGCAGYYADISPLGTVGSQQHYALSGDTITIDNLYPQTYIIHTYPFNFGIFPLLCEQYDTVVVPNGPCISPYTISVQQPSTYQCPNGIITLTNTDDCYWLSSLYKGDTSNFIGGFWDNNSYGPTFSINQLFGHGFNSGTYFIKSQVYNQANFGQMTFCNVWDTVILNAPCQMSTLIINQGCAGGNCNCSLGVIGNTGGCSHFETRVQTLNGTLVSYGTTFSGDTLEFTGLNPGTYVLHTIPETYGLPVICEKYDTVIIQNALCSSPYTISVQDASCYNCQDGNIILTNHSNCPWFSTVYVNDTTQFYTSTFSNFIFGGVISLNNFRGDWPAGTYYIHSITNLPNNNGDYNLCDVWDTIVINEPPCSVSAQVFTTGCEDTHCNCTIKVFSQLPSNGLYQSQVVFLDDGVAVESDATSSGDTLSFNALYPGTYVVITKPYINGVETDCADFDTIVVADGPCTSPYTYEIRQPNGYGCNNGNITLTNHSDCFWITYVYKNDTSQIFSGPIPNNIFGGVFQLEYFTGGLGPGTYYIHSYVYPIYYNDHHQYCDVWDTIVIAEPSCLNNISVFTSGCEGSTCGCSIKVTSLTSACSYMEAQLSTIGGTFIIQGAANSGDTVSFDFLYPGTYVVHSYIVAFDLPNSCHRYDTIVIPAGACISPYTFESIPSSGINCNDGNIITTNHSPCYWITSIYLNDTSNLIYSSFVNLAFGGVISLDDYIGGLGAGLYILRSIAYTPGYNDQYFNCEVWDTIAVGVTCRITGNFIAAFQPVLPACSNGTISVAFSHSDCNQLYVKLIDQSDSSVISSQLLTNQFYVQYSGLAAGTYIVEATNFSDTTCKWAGTITLTCQQQFISINIKAYIEGFYLGGGLMQASVDPIAYPNLCDTMTMELRQSNYPYGLVNLSKTTINTSGEASFEIPGVLAGNTFYIVLHHRNALETWSSNPQVLSDNIFYDFSNAANKAYGNNQADLGDGKFAMFSGDISDALSGNVGIQDGVVESQDYADMENAIIFVLVGYNPQDITGDNVVESSDYSLMENNVSLTRVVIRP